MKKIITRNDSAFRLAFVALVLSSIYFGFCWLQRPNANAQIQDGSVRFVTYSGTVVFGIAAGQTARFCVGTSTTNPRTLDWTTKILNERGIVLFQLPEIHSPAGEWRCGDVPRNSLAVPGEAGTGRVQVAAGLTVQAPLGTKSSELISSWELIGEDGSTAAGGVVLYAVFHNND